MAAPPDFAPNPGVSWVADQGGFKSPASGPGPVRDDPLHPTVTNDDFRLTGRQPSFSVADLSNPILQPWVRDVLARHNQAVLAGRPGFGPRQSCWLVGVPGFHLGAVFQPLFIVQTAREVVMMWQTDNHQVRHVYLDVPHSANVKPSWFGESVGHYEGGTLVVDTIGLNDRTVLDDYMTPHTEKLHVVERFHLSDGGRTMEVDLQVEDPGAFTRPWSAVQIYRRVEPGVSDNALLVAEDATTGRTSAGPMLEEVCSENPNSLFGQEAVPIPRADKPDF